MPSGTPSTSAARKIEQIMVTQFGESRVDRCTTCHIASDDPRFQGHAEPLQTHPYSAAMGDVSSNGRWERRHKFTDFGCTVCHDGQGRGLEAFYAHGEDEFWPDPCWATSPRPTGARNSSRSSRAKSTCRPTARNATPKRISPERRWSSAAAQLFFENNCYGCHALKASPNGTLGPELTEVGKKCKIDYLWEHTVDPRAYRPTSFMPKFKLTRRRNQGAVIFLKSRRGINFAETSLGQYRARLQARLERGRHDEPAAYRRPAARGEQLIGERSCTACHKLGDKDGGIAPDLSYEGLMREQTG